MVLQSIKTTQNYSKNHFLEPFTGLIKSKDSREEVLMFRTIKYDIIMSNTKERRLLC